MSQTYIHIYNSFYYLGKVDSKSYIQIYRKQSEKYHFVGLMKYDPNLENCCFFYSDKDFIIIRKFDYIKVIRKSDNAFVVYENFRVGYILRGGFIVVAYQNYTESFNIFEFKSRRVEQYLYDRAFSIEEFNSLLFCIESGGSYEIFDAKKCSFSDRMRTTSYELPILITNIKNVDVEQCMNFD